MLEINPVVSVCVITYNHSSYIEQCLNSILEQKVNFNFEICIGEDFSSDGTREICQKYAEKYPDKIRLFLRDRKDVIHLNGEPTGTFNFFATLIRCKGKYIAICEGDDFWTDPLKLQKQVNLLRKNPDCAICHCNVTVTYEDGTPTHPAYATPQQKRKMKKCGIGIIATPQKKMDITDLAKRNCIHTPGVLFKNWLNDNPLPLYVWKAGLGDWALHMGSARFGKLIFIDEKMATYRIHKHGFWSNAQNIKKLQIITGTTCAMILSHEFSAETIRILEKKLFKLIYRTWKNSAKTNNPSAISAVLCEMATVAPELVPESIQYIQNALPINLLRRISIKKRTPLSQKIS